MRALWSGEPVSYEGRFSRFTDVTLTPRPTRATIEPWLGGSTAAAARRVGRIADGWLASGVSPDQFGSLVQVIRDQATESGRTVPEDHFGTILLVAAEERGRRPSRTFGTGAARRSSLRPSRSAPTRSGIGSSGSAPAGRPSSCSIHSSADPRPLLRELKGAVVDPLEAAPVLR